MTTIGNNLKALHARIAIACATCARNPDSVSVLAVSKTFGPDAVLDAVQAGQRAFGENYIQEAVLKMAQVAAAGAPPLQWHCIGPVQSNKTRLVAEHFDWVHTVDRLKTAQRLNDQRPPHLSALNVCIQVNVDGGPTKSGASPQEAVELALTVARLPHLALRGVMSIPDAVEDFDAQCAVHRRVKAVFDAIAAALPPDHASLDTLSLGMTADLEAAIRAGSTLVRVGSGIFGARHYASATP